MLRYKKLFAFFVASAIFYVLQTVLQEPDREAMAKYNLTETHIILLALTIILPYVVIWFIALSGYTRLKDYTSKIRRSKDGDAFNKISRGILAFAIWLPISAITSTALTNAVKNNPDQVQYFAWLNLFVNLLLLSYGFYHVYIGSRQLVYMVKNRHYTRVQQVCTVVFAALMVLYIYFIFQDPARQFISGEVNRATYYMPDWLIVSAILIPRLVMWTAGLLAVYNLYLYRKNIKGFLYKHALKNLAFGFSVVILTIIGLRYLESASSYLVDASLGALLMLYYAILIVMAVGYIYIARGARNLQRLEEL